MVIPLKDETRAEVISSVLGQLSDGIWEDSGAMNKYWKFAHVNGTDLEISDERYDYGYGGYLSTKNGFYDKTEKDVRDWFANKAKQIVKIWAEDCNKDPNAIWNRANDNDIVDYMGGHKVPDITVADVYECYDFLKGRSGKKYGIAANPLPYEVEGSTKRTGAKYPSNYIKSSYDRAEILEQRVPQIIDWGESMYGGYFFNYIGEDKEVDGCHADSIEELEAQANSLGFTLKGAKRFDNTGGPFGCGKEHGIAWDFDNDSGPFGWNLDDVEGSDVLLATKYPSNYIRTAVIPPKYHDGDIAYEGNATSYQCTQVISGDINNFPSELDDYVWYVQCIGDNLYRIYFLMADEPDLTDKSYAHFESIVYPILENAGFSLEH